MRRRKHFTGEDDAEVAMSPLIDCVFLLLIFFLVTTMIKRKEQLIPINLPDSSSVISVDSEEDTIIIGLDRDGRAYKTTGNVTNEGAIVYHSVDDLAAHLLTLINAHGQAVLDRPLRIDADRETPFQLAIDAVDICKLQGFNNVGLKTRGGKK